MGVLTKDLTIFGPYQLVRKEMSIEAPEKDMLKKKMRVSAEGQTTIPIEMREFLDLSDEGDDVEFVFTSDWNIEVRNPDKE